MKLRSTGVETSGLQAASASFGFGMKFWGCHVSPQSPGRGEKGTILKDPSEGKWWDKSWDFRSPLRINPSYTPYSGRSGYGYWIPITFKNGSVLRVQQLPGTIPRDKNYL